MQLVTIAFSHYNERARWALDHFGVEYRERPHVPGWHMLGVARATGLRGGSADGVSSRWSTPVLVIEPGRCLNDSGEIVHWASETYGTPETTLYPEEHRTQIEEIEQHFHDAVGSDTRRLAYRCTYDHPGMLAEMARDNVGWVQAASFRWGAGLLRPMVRRLASLPDEAAVEQALARVIDHADGLSAQLQGRRYLVGDRFTAADLTVACMLSPVIGPSPEEGYGAVLPSLDVLDDAWRARVLQMRQSPAGRYVLRMFDQERPPVLRA